MQLTTRGRVLCRRVATIAVACATAALIGLPAAASARTKIVYSGGTPAFQKKIFKRYAGGESYAFYLHTMTINQGDTVVWDGVSKSLGFHSIDLPGPSRKDLPLTTAFPTSPVTGVQDAAGNSFWFNGQPSLGFNPALLALSRGHKYDGSSRVDSGLPLGPPISFKVTFIKPGTYTYFCDVHYGMKGTVRVLATGNKAPTAAQDAKALTDQLKRAAAAAKQAAKTRVHRDEVSLGAAGPDNTEALSMFPATLRVKMGSIVTFSMPLGTHETHTVTFGDTSKAGYVTRLGKIAFTSAMFDPRGPYPSDPTQPIALNPTTHGNGFASLGGLDRDNNTPLPPTGQIKFTKPGTYHYICLIHPFMHGTIVVS